MNAHNDPPLPLGAKSYLAAFDRYLFAQTHTEKVEARHDMREQLDVMIDHSEADVDIGRVRHSRGRRFSTETALRQAYVEGEIDAETFERRIGWWLKKREAA